MVTARTDVLLTADGAEPTLSTGGPGRVAGVLVSEFVKRADGAFRIALMMRGGALLGHVLTEYVDNFLLKDRRRASPALTLKDGVDPVLLWQSVSHAARTLVSDRNWSAARTAAVFAAKRRQGIRAVQSWTARPDRGSAQIIHSHMAGAAVPAKTIKRLTPGKAPALITTFHTKGSIVRELPPLLARSSSTIALLRRHEEEAIRWSDAVTFPSRGAANLMRIDHPELARADIRIVYNGIDADRIARAAAGFKAGRVASQSREWTLVNVAAHEPQKKIHIVLEALRALREYRPCRLVQIGGGPLSRDLRAHAERLGVAAYTNWIGKVPNDEVIRLVSTSDAYVVTSTNVIFDLATLEAMAVGIPVILTRDGGNVECVTHGENGVLIDVDSASDVVEAVRSLWDNPLRAAELAANAQERARRDFTTTAMADAYLRLYQEMASCRRRSRQAEAGA